MSNYVNYKGYLKEVDNPNKLSIEDLCKELCMMKNFKMESWDCDWKDCLFSNSGYDSYVVVNDKLFEVLELKERDMYECYCNITKQENGRYLFETLYYNGGTCLQEMLEDNWIDSE